jgi:hypothetical protein
MGVEKQAKLNEDLNNEIHNKTPAVYLINKNVYPLSFKVDL